MPQPCADAGDWWIHKAPASAAATAAPISVFVRMVILHRVDQIVDRNSFESGGAFALPAHHSVAVAVITHHAGAVTAAPTSHVVARPIILALAVAGPVAVHVPVTGAVSAHPAI